MEEKGVSPLSLNLLAFKSWVQTPWLESRLSSQVKRKKGGGGECTTASFLQDPSVACGTVEGMLLSPIIMFYDLLWSTHSRFTKQFFRFQIMRGGGYEAQHKYLLSDEKKPERERWSNFAANLKTGPFSSRQSSSYSTLFSLKKSEVFWLISLLPTVRLSDTSERCAGHLEWDIELEEHWGWMSWGSKNEKR